MQFMQRKKLANIELVFAKIAVQIRGKQSIIGVYERISAYAPILGVKGNQKGKYKLRETKRAKKKIL